MSFTRKHVVIGTPVRDAQRHQQNQPMASGTRPSPLDGRLTTSTGTPSLDQYLAGHFGFPLGTSLLIAESGTTDFSGVLLKYYAAEGLVQGHHVHLVGLDESWQAELPGLSQDANINEPTSAQLPGDKMKIAWRYEGLRGTSKTDTGEFRDNVPRVTSPGETPFCHHFDLSSKLEPRMRRGQLHSIPLDSASRSSRRKTPNVPPLYSFIATLADSIEASEKGSIHRVIITNFLSPTLYPQAYCKPSEALRFVHGLRALLREYSGQLSAMLSLSTSLYPTSTGFIRWMDILCDGVLEVIPTQSPVHSQLVIEKPDTSAQGILRVHKLPIHNERGGGIEGQACRENLSFKLSPSSGLTIKPFSLPPVHNTETLLGDIKDSTVLF
ncbi:PAXNEB-domain-containing protein [Sodiomyces alkalinus F11]|uniref:Elongator complex protein 4 n=1 Tax=Sodiomyces alkalinus (strain CBS 110278 / VKM F-3762 / F11) TaxID=1314773 RepID=A0A3N2PKA7_SODAK|nr:PAXNEB-domain-containing protein [Sodiomyces alkalinus F11]ROT34834.1 PAXNEB-domain-containing protein [Sodiomyces alkalinus F11]